MNEILNQILSELQHLKIGQDKTNADIQLLKAGQDKTNEEIQHLKIAQDKTNEEIQHLKVAQDKTNEEIHQLKIVQDKTNVDIQHLKVAQDKTNVDIQHLKVAQDKVNSRLDNIEQNMVTKADLENVLAEQQKDIMSVLTVTYNQIDEKLNTINQDITDIKEALNKVEFVTASNWKDITRLKSIK